MKRKIVIADRDESLQHAFSIVLPKEHYEIHYASNGKEVEKLAERVNPDIYVINVNLPKMNGIELHKKLQKDRYLDDATFFFLKDENDTTQLLGYQAAGVIEKPINFFQVYETITREEDVIDLTDPVEEEREIPRAPVGATHLEEVTSPHVAAAERPEGATAAMRKPIESADWEGAGPEADLGKRLQEAIGTVTGETVEDTEGRGSLEDRIRTALDEVLAEASGKLADRLATEIAGYVQDSVHRILLEVAEKVIREEIDKLLKESTT